MPTLLGLAPHTGRRIKADRPGRQRPSCLCQVAGRAGHYVDFAQFGQPGGDLEAAGAIDMNCLSCTHQMYIMDESCLSLSPNRASICRR